MLYQQKQYRKILIIGSPGSGKSYLSKQLHKITSIKVWHLDVEFWNPDWVMTPREAFIEKLYKIMEHSQWIVEGNYEKTMDIRWAQADCVIYLNPNRVTCLWGIIRRHGKKRCDLPEYLEEKIDREFFSFLWYTWKFKSKEHGSILERQRKFCDKKFIELKSRRDIKNFLQQCQSK